MNKNTKKFVVTLLSVLMVLSFMPTMAFAAAPVDAAHHSWKVDEEKSLAPTCTEPGYTVYKCTEDGCNVTYAEPTAALGHEWPTNGVQYTIPEFLEAAAKSGWTDARIERWAELLDADCYVYAKACKKCGLLDTPDEYGDHVRPTSAAACAETYECAFCHKTVKEAGAAHTWSEWKTVAENICAKNHDPIDLDGIDKQERTCEKCNKKETRYITSVGDGSVADETPLDDLSEGLRNWYLKRHTDHNIKPVDPQPEDAAAEGKYAYWDSKWYEANTVITPATCYSEGEKGLVCPDCGLRLEAVTASGDIAHPVVIPMTAHTWTTYTVKPDCEHDGYTRQYCSVCYAFGTKTAGDKALGHDYKVTDAMKPNCEYDGLTLIECTRCDRREITRTSEHVQKVDDKYFFKGFNNELLEGAPATAPYSKCIEVADWAHGAHSWGAFEDYQAATCTEPAYQAKKCQKCGSFYHANKKPVGEPLGHDAVVTVLAAKCGTEGNTTSLCSRCGKRLDKNGKAHGEEGCTEEFVWDVTKPVVAYGAECSYEWVVLQEPTIDEDGLEAYVCSECGDIFAMEVIPYNTDARKKEEMEKSKPIIIAAAEITNNASKYTDDSVKAIEEAKTNLDTACSAGTAADVTRANAALQKAIDAAQLKAANPMTAKGKTVKATSKKAKTFTAKKAFTVKNAQGKVTYKKANKKGGAKIKVASNGKVTVKKGLKKGTYKVKVKVTAAGNGNYLKKTKAVTLTVKITK